MDKLLVIIPQIELQKGFCNFCIKGASEMTQVYYFMSQNPDVLSKLLRRENSKILCIFDLDSFQNVENKININSCLSIANSVEIPISLISNIQSSEQCKYLINNHIRKIALFDLAFSRPESVYKLIKEFTSSLITFFVPSNNDFTYFPNLELNISIYEYFEQVRKLGGDRIVFKDIGRENQNIEPDFEKLVRIANDYKLKITLLSDVSKPQTLWKLQKITHFGIDSLIMGSSFFENNFPCQNIWRDIEAELEMGLFQINCLLN